MISHLHTGPMPPDEGQPLFGPVLIRRSAGEVVTRFGGALVGFLHQPGVAHHNEAAREGEASLQGLYVEGMQAARFDSAVAAIVEDKKGVSLSASSF